jgi:hypothetical protein
MADSAMSSRWKLHLVYSRLLTRSSTSTSNKAYNGKRPILLKNSVFEADEKIMVPQPD